MILICKADPGCLTNLENTTSSPEILRPSDHRLLVLASIMWMGLRLCLLTLLKCSWMLERSISEALKKLTNSLLRNTLERQPEYGSRVPLWKVTYPLSSSLWITASKVSIPKSFWENYSSELFYCSNVLRSCWEWLRGRRQSDLEHVS